MGDPNRQEASSGDLAVPAEYFRSLLGSRSESLGMQRHVEDVIILCLLLLFKRNGFLLQRALRNVSGGAPGGPRTFAIASLICPADGIVGLRADRRSLPPVAIGEA